MIRRNVTFIISVMERLILEERGTQVDKGGLVCLSPQGTGWGGRGPLQSQCSRDDSELFLMDDFIPSCFHVSEDDE